VIGGIAIFIAASSAISAVGISDQRASALLIAASFTVMVGVVDDRYGLAPFTRILAHIAAASTLVFVSGQTIKKLRATSWASGQSNSDLLMPSSRS
jgi:UDP-N-acetylmuramyl pentapeptide phosphotransferase/UDP-N-acetylglucosamine-1-phosphate transferase